MPQPEQQQDVTHSSASRTSRSRILVIDDGDSVRDVIGIFLENAGFEVRGEAADGVAGIEQAKKFRIQQTDGQFTVLGPYNEDIAVHATREEAKEESNRCLEEINGVKWRRYL